MMRWQRLGLLVMVGVALWLFINPEKLGGPRGAVLHLIASAQRALRVGDRLPSAGEQKLRGEVHSLRQAILVRDEELLRARQQLRELRGYHELLPEQRKWARLPARVSGRSAPRSGRVLVVLDRGRRDGVRDGMPVISGCSLAGLVLEAHLASCVVALLTDPECRIRTFLRSELDPTDNGATASPPVGRHVGVAVGTSKGLTLQLVRIEQAPREGDLVLTSAFDGRTPTGLLVGRVGRVVKLAHEYQARVEVVPAVDLTQVDQLHILLRPAVPFPERQKKKEASKKPGKAISALQAAPSGR